MLPSMSLPQICSLCVCCATCWGAQSEVIPAPATRYSFSCWLCRQRYDLAPITTQRGTHNKVMTIPQHKIEGAERRQGIAAAVPGAFSLCPLYPLLLCSLDSLVCRVRPGYELPKVQLRLPKVRTCLLDTQEEQCWEAGRGSMGNLAWQTHREPIWANPWGCGYMVAISSALIDMAASPFCPSSCRRSVYSTDGDFCKNKYELPVFAFIKTITNTNCPPFHSPPSASVHHHASERHFVGV
jgi:hypothetical protein